MKAKLPVWVAASLKQKGLFLGNLKDNLAKNIREQSAIETTFSIIA